jgi:hypothetical protein
MPPSCFITTSIWDEKHNDSAATDYNPEDQKLVTHATQLPLASFLFWKHETDLCGTSPSSFTSRAIPVQVNHQQQVRRRDDDDDEEAMIYAEHCDFCVYARILDGILTQVERQRIPHPELAQQNIQTLNNIVRTRQHDAGPSSQQNYCCRRFQQKYFVCGGLDDDHELKNKTRTTGYNTKHERRWGTTIPMDENDDRRSNMRTSRILFEQHTTNLETAFISMNVEQGDDELSLFFPMDM